MGWEITNEDLLADEDFCDNAEEFGSYIGFDFYYQVQQVADRIFALHQEREIDGEFVFGYDSNYEGEINGGFVSVNIDRGPYIAEWVDAKNLTNDREATGVDQAFAIRDALMQAYDRARSFAVQHGILVQ